MTDPIADRKYVPRPGAADEAFNPEDITLLFDLILIERDQDEEKTAGGLYKPDSVRELKHTGWVVATGAHADIVTPGQRVIFGKYRGVELTLNDKPYVICEQGDLLAIIAPEVKSDRND